MAWWEFHHYPNPEQVQDLRHISMGYKMKLYFQTNPYFTNMVIVKEFQCNRSGKRQSQGIIHAPPPTLVQYPPHSLLFPQAGWCLTPPQSAGTGARNPRPKGTGTKTPTTASLAGSQTTASQRPTGLLRWDPSEHCQKRPCWVCLLVPEKLAVSSGACANSFFLPSPFSFNRLLRMTCGLTLCATT